MDTSDNFQVRVYETENPRIETFLSENGSVFHSFDYLSSVGDEYSCIAIQDADTVIAALPLVQSTKNKLKAYHIPPHSHLFGPVVNKKFINKSYELIKILLDNLPKSSHYDFKIYDNGDILPYLETGFSLSSVQTHIWKATKDYSINSISKNKKRYIIKLEELIKTNQLQVFENDVKQHKNLLDLYMKTSERAGFNPKLDTLITLFNSGIPSYSNIIMGQDGKAIAGTFCPKDKSNLYHILSLGLRLEDKLLSRANYLSLFYAVKYANSQNLNFDFEGSSIPGVAQFYRMMGGEPTTMLRVQKTRSVYYHILRFGQVLKSELLINR